MITANNLSKSFNNKCVVNSISLSIKKGQIYGLLGPNGAGKTTVLRLLSTVLEPDSGEVSIAGHNIVNEADSIKTKIGYVAQYFGLYSELTVLENIRFYANMYGVKDEELFHKLMKKYSIDIYSNTKAGALSGGYKRRLSLICALTHNPDVLFLDEPTAGIDPVTRKHLWDIFYELSLEGKTLFVTTHYMEEAERCNMLAFLNQGEIVSQGNVEEVKKALVGYKVVLITPQIIDSALINSFKNNPNILLVNQFANDLRLVIKKDVELNEYDAHEVDANLEDVFIALTQGDTND